MPVTINLTNFIYMAGMSECYVESLASISVTSKLLPFVEQLDVKFFSSCNHATLLMELQQLQRQD